MSERLLQESLSSEFKDYESKATSAMRQVFDLQAYEFSNHLSAEESRLQSIAADRDEEIQTLIAHLARLRQVKSVRSKRLYRLYERKQNQRKLQTVLNCWLEYYNSCKRRNKMNVYVSNYSRRSSFKKIFKEWKQQTLEIHREKVGKINHERTQREIEKNTGQVNEECQRMREMISELTEDLRNETLARLQLKHKFEQALMRGVNALNAESNNLHDGHLGDENAVNEASMRLMSGSPNLLFLNKVN
jgi:hypothetical protein